MGTMNIVVDVSAMAVETLTITLRRQDERDGQAPRLPRHHRRGPIEAGKGGRVHGDQAVVFHAIIGVAPLKLAKEGRSMATKLVTQKAAPARAKKAVAKKAAAKKATLAKAKASVKKAPATPKAGKTKPSRSGLPAATIRALKELEAGKLNRYADADDLFRKLGIKLGKD
jgi:hypothetical protein